MTDSHQKTDPRPGGGFAHDFGCKHDPCKCRTLRRRVCRWFGHFGRHLEVTE